MTDRELLEAFLEQTGLNRGTLRLTDMPVVERDAAAFMGLGGVVTLHEGEGYDGFFVAFTFDGDGKLVSFGVWE